MERHDIIFVYRKIALLGLVFTHHDPIWFLLYEFFDQHGTFAVDDHNTAANRRFRKKSESADYSLHERRQHSGRVLELTDQAGVLAARVSEEHIVDVMVVRSLLSVAQRDPALKFKLDYQRASLAAHVTASYSLVRSSHDTFRREAYRRWRNAVRELGMVLSGVVISTVCHDLLPTPKDIPALQRRLSVLMDWYKIPKNAS